MKNKNTSKAGDKVYWVRGFPNNGWGRILIKVPFIPWYMVRDSGGKVIACDTVYPIECMLKDKQDTVDDLNKHESLSYDLMGIRDLNKEEIRKGLEYLYKSEKC